MLACVPLRQISWKCSCTASISILVILWSPDLATSYSASQILTTYRSIPASIFEEVLAMARQFVNLLFHVFVALKPLLVLSCFNTWLRKKTLIGVVFVGILEFQIVFHLKKLNGLWSLYLLLICLIVHDVCFVEKTAWNLNSFIRLRLFFPYKTPHEVQSSYPTPTIPIIKNF